MQKFAVPLTPSWRLAVRSPSCWETRETNALTTSLKKKKNPVYEKRRLNQAWAPTVGLSIGPAGLVWQVSERSLNIQSLNHYQMRGASGNQTELMDPALLKPPVGSAGPERSISASCFSLPTLIVQ